MEGRRGVEGMERGWRGMEGDGGGTACEPLQNQRPPYRLESGTKAYGVYPTAMVLKRGSTYPWGYCLSTAGVTQRGVVKANYRL